MRGTRALVKCLKEEGVKFLFGLAGNTKIYAELYDFPEIKPILVRHECSGAFMAYAVGRLTGRPGVVHATSGPGVAYIVPGMLEAFSGCIPVFAPCRAPPTAFEGMGVLQETEQMAMIRPITKASYRIQKADRIPWYVQRGFSLAVNGKPGPVYIEIPDDVAVEEAKPSTYVKSTGIIRCAGDPERITEAANLISLAQRPVIVAGGGLILSRASNELIRFASMLGIPVLTSASGRGSIPENHPLSVGLIGLYRTQNGKEVFEEADLVISVGCRFEELSSGRWKFWPEGAKFIQVDIDSSEIARNFVPDVGVVGDAKIVLNQLVDAVHQRIRRGRTKSQRLQSLLKAKSEYEAAIEKECKTKTLRTKLVVRTLNSVFAENTILVNENGAADLWSYYSPYYKVLDAGDCIPPAEQTAMGLGVAGSIAAKLVMPNKKVVTVCGDASFQMFMKELPTAVQYNAAVTWVVLNDFSIGWNKWTERLNTGGKYVGVDFEVQPDFRKIAEANKCFGLKVERASEVEGALRAALKANEEGLPAVLDFLIEPFDYNEFFREFHAKVWNYDASRVYER